MSNLLFFYVAGRHTAKFSPERVVFRFSYGGHHPAPLYRLFAVTEHVPVVRSVWKTTLKYLKAVAVTAVFFHLFCLLFPPTFLLRRSVSNANPNYW